MPVSQRWRTYAVGATVWLTASYGIAIGHIQLFEPAASGPTASAYFDAIRYVGMVQGKEEPAPYRYRVLVPGIAKQIPDRVILALTSRPQPTPEWLAGAKIDVVNVIFLALTGAALCGLLMGLGFGPVASLLGSFLFYATRSVLQFGGVPMVDPASWFFLALAVMMVVEQRPLALMLVFLTGVFAKETLLLAAVFICLLSTSARRRLQLLAALVPGAVAFLVVRGMLMRSGHVEVLDPWVSPARASWMGAAINRMLSLRGLVDMGSSFGLLWVPAIYGFRALPSNHPLRRWALVVPTLLLAILWFSTNVGRLLFLSFPVVIPLALVGGEKFLNLESGLPGLVRERTDAAEVVP